MLVWLLGIFTALLLLLCLLRVGILLSGTTDVFTVDARIAGFRFRIFPGKEKSIETTKEANKKAEKQPKAKLSLNELKDAVKTLWPPLKKALQRTRRGILIHPLNLRIVIGGAEDPAAAAEYYGYLNAGVWTAMPALEELLNIPEPSIHSEIDFASAENSLKGELGLSARFGRLLMIMLGLGIPVIQWYRQHQQKRKQPAAASRPTAEERTGHDGSYNG